MRKSLSIIPISLALVLGACSGEADADGASAVSSEPIAEIAAPEGTKWSETVNPSEAGGLVMGNPDAPIKLVEYMSITCSVCATFGEAGFDAIRDKYVESGRVSFEIRNFVRDPIDLSAALLSRCGGNAPYFALTKAILGDQNALLTRAQQVQAQGRLDAALQAPLDSRFVQLAEAVDLISFFQQRGIAEDQARTCLADTEAAEKLMNDTQRAATEENVQGTPTFLLNGRRLDGTSWPVVETALQEAGAR